MYIQYITPLFRSFQHRIAIASYASRRGCVSRLVSKRTTRRASGKFVWIGLAVVSWREEKSYICDSRSRTTYYISTRHLVVVSWSFVGGVVSVKVFSHIFLSTRRCKWRVPDTRGRDCLPERYELVEENFCNELGSKDFSSNEI